MYRRGGVFLTALLLVSLLFSLSSCSGGTSYVGTGGGTSYTVTFETNGGSAVDSQTVAAGETAKEPEAPKNGDYKFGGWYSDSGLTTPFSFDTAITADITLYAMWTEKAVIQAGSISYATTSVSKTTADEAFTNTLTKTGNGDVTYTSSNTAVATVDEKTGKVTIKGAGEATITATVTDSDTYTYATKTASYTLTVEFIPEGFVKVAGTTIAGTETWTPTSIVFVSGRSLTIPDLYVCDHEVTRGEFKALMGTDPSTAPAYDKDGNGLTGDNALNNPVTDVNWYEAIAYCNKLSIKEGLAPAYTVSGITDWKSLAYSNIPTLDDATWNAATCDFTANGYRLPTEAEWEWLARGGQNYTYAGSGTVGDVAWYTGNTNNTGSRDVKTKAANGYGLYDMSGNVWEWCWDWSDTITESTPAAGASSGSVRVDRGGFWNGVASYCAVSYRDDGSPYGRFNSCGFRVVRSSSN